MGIADLISSGPMSSRAWRLCNLYTIVDDKAKLRAFDPFPWQRDFYNRLHYCNHVLKARKMGYSTFIEMLNLDDLLFIGGLTAGIVDKGMDDAVKKLKMVKTAYDNLDNEELHPETWQIGRQIKRAVRIVRATTEELEFSNKSVFYCGVSLRGGTLNRLHISELGYTAINAPKKAQEILNGAMNAFTAGNRCDIESTHEGGKVGLHYNLLRKAIKRDDTQLTAMDFRFHFFPWYLDTRCDTLDRFAIRPEIVEYFDKLSAELGRTFTHGQMLWYDRKEDLQGYGMKKEFPSTTGEAFEAMGDNAIYGKWMADLRGAGRIVPQGFQLHQELPVYTFSDIGLSDYLSTWLIQPAGQNILVLDWMEWQGLPGSKLNDKMLLWERKWDKVISAHYMPHDATRRSPNDGLSYQAALEAGGMKNIRIVPRTPDVWLGIGYGRDVLPHCWFHGPNCDTPRQHNGEEHPSGVACLEGYQIDVSATGNTLRELPKHDAFSHSADAFRTFAEAWRRGMINPSTNQAPPRAVGGPVRARR
jgi:hypothetical protein